jgi:recombination DNA repair RAD52 pathway protein
MEDNFSLVSSGDHADLGEIQTEKYEAALKALIAGKTPKRVVYSKPGGRGQPMDYVPGWWFIDQLNALFGYNWDFEIRNQAITGTQIWVLGRLTVRTAKGVIIKEAFGGSQMKSIKNTAIDLGDDFKTAATDSLKKAATLLGLASDIYGKREVSELRSEEGTPDPKERFAKLYEIGKAKGLTSEQVETNLKEYLKKDLDNISDTGVLKYMPVLRAMPDKASDG